MSARYDLYKEEALRLLFSPQTLADAVGRHIRALRCPLVPGVRCMINHADHQTIEKTVVTVAGDAQVVENKRWPLSHGSEAKERAKRQNQWLCRRLKRLGQSLGASPILISTRDGTVYFSYHVAVDQVSHIGDC